MITESEEKETSFIDFLKQKVVIKVYQLGIVLIIGAVIGVLLK